MNILLTCVGRRHYLANFFVDALAGAGRVIGVDMVPTAPGLQACNSVHIGPSVFDPDYLGWLQKVIVSESIDMVFSLNDLEIGMLASSRSAIEAETGATLYVPPLETLSICADKWATFCFGRDHGLPVPATFLSVEAAMSAVEDGQITFPLIVKPRWGSASIGLFQVSRPDDLATAVSNCKAAIAKSCLANFGSEDDVLVQEFLGGAEYGADLLYSKRETFIGFTVKQKIAMRAGETDKAVTVEPSRFKPLVERIAVNLPHRGNLDCDFLEKDGLIYLLELNPRFGGGYPFTHLAGANHVQMLINDFDGKPLPPYAYECGRAFAKCDHLVETTPPVGK